MDFKGASRNYFRPQILKWERRGKVMRNRPLLCIVLVVTVAFLLSCEVESSKPKPEAQPQRVESATSPTPTPVSTATPAPTPTPTAPPTPIPTPHVMSEYERGVYQYYNEIANQWFAEGSRALKEGNTKRYVESEQYRELNLDAAEKAKNGIIIPTPRPTPVPTSIPYTVSKQWTIPNAGYGKVIVVDPRYRNERDMRILGNMLQDESRGDRKTFIFIFDDARAAAMHGKLMDVWSPQEIFYFSHFIGTYSKNTGTGFHQLVIALNGFDRDGIVIDY
ncbi:MAG: hypothetical protein V2A74_04450 [bacterium]